MSSQLRGLLGQGGWTRSGQDWEWRGWVTWDLIAGKVGWAPRAHSFSLCFVQDQSRVSVYTPELLLVAFDYNGNTFKILFGGWGDGSVGQVFLRKHAELNSDPSHVCKSQVWYISASPVLGRWSWGDPGVCWSAGLAKWQAPGSVREYLSNNKADNERGRCPILIPHFTCAHTSMHANTIPTHRYTSHPQTQS